MKLTLTRTSATLLAALACTSISLPSLKAQDKPNPTNLDKVEVRPPPGWNDHLLSWYQFQDFGAIRGNRPNGGVLPNHTAKEQETDNRSGTCPDGAEAKGNPVILYTGNKVESEMDFFAQGEMGLYLQRTYNHQWGATGIFGNHWISNFDFSLAFSNGESIAWIQRPNGSRLKLLADATLDRWNEDKAQSVAYMVRNADGTFSLFNENRGVETYSADGYITRLQSQQGVAWSFAYDAKYLRSVTHSSGRNIQFTWSGDQLVQVTDPAGNAYRYTYTANAFEFGRSRLASAILPGTPATTISYHYEDARYPGGLTGKSFNGVRYSYFAYDDNQRATLTEHAGGVERYTFTYSVASSEPVAPPPAPVRPGGLKPLETGGWCDYRGGGRHCYPSEVNNQSRVASSQATSATTDLTKDRPVEISVTSTNPLGRKTTQSFEDGRLVSVAGQASPRCAASYKESTYDQNGYPDLVSDFADNLTDFDYSPQGFLLKKVEAVGTSAERTTTYEWDTAANRQLKETILGDSETSYTYEARGNIASITVRNLSSKGVPGQARTTNYTYTYHANGLKASMTVDGPLSQDNVTYTFNTLGDMTSVSNGLGQTTTYSNYTGLGEPGRVTGPNGDVTELNRDARGRLTSQKQPAGTGWATTSLTYDGAGNVATTTSPDGITTRYQYDAARRLIAETRPFGNGNYAWTQHSYDAASNVTRTEVSLTDYPVDSAISGIVESIEHDAQWNWYAKGWACSTGSNASIQVQGYAEGGIHLGTVTANLASEPQVAAACQANGSAYRFQLPISLAQRQQLGGKALQVYGLSPRGGTYNQALGNLGAFTIPTATIIGDVATVSNDNWNFAVQGWACSVGVNSPTTVHVYAGGAAGAGTYIGAATGVLVPNEDVKAACQGQGAYWFSVPLTIDIRQAHGGKALYVHGISPSGQANLLINRSGAFTIPALIAGAELVGFAPNPSRIFNGDETTLTAQFRNTGNYIWDGYTYLQWGVNGPSQFIPMTGSVAPGQVATFQWIVAPFHAGTGVGTFTYEARIGDRLGAWGAVKATYVTVENADWYCPPNKPYCEEPW